MTSLSPRIGNEVSYVTQITFILRAGAVFGEAGG